MAAGAAHLWKQGSGRTKLGECILGSLMTAVAPPAPAESGLRQSVPAGSNRPLVRLSTPRMQHAGYELFSLSKPMMPPLHTPKHSAREERKEKLSPLEEVVVNHHVRCMGCQVALPCNLNSVLGSKKSFLFLSGPSPTWCQVGRLSFQKCGASLISACKNE